MTDLLQSTPIEVAVSGELVLLTLGNLHFKLEFQLALQLAAAIRFNAGIAKVQAGHEGFSRRRVFGVLNDLSASQPRRKRFAEKLPELLPPRGLDVSTDGALVVLKLGKVTAKLPYAVAFTVAQWLRVRGKEARNNAGETQHWSEFGALQATEELRKY